VPPQYAIYLQLLGGIWIIQTLPSVMLGTYTRWFDPWALVIGWAVGIGTGTWMFIAAKQSPNYPLAIGGFNFPGYSALYTLILNLVVATILTLLFNAAGKAQPDETVAADYRP
jgi:SSS family solute:Na+ symporter